MTIHTCRDLIVGSTGSYGNFYALGCFMVGVLGFTQVGASGHAAFVSSLLPTPITSGSFSGSALFGSGGTGILEIPLAGLPVISGTYYLPVGKLGPLHHDRVGVLAWVQRCDGHGDRNLQHLFQLQVK